MKNKKGIYIIVGIVVFIILLTFIFIFSRIIKKDNFIVNNFEISLDNNVDKNEFTNLGPIKDEDSYSVTPYKFSIRNTDSQDSTYNLLIEDKIDNKKSSKLLSRKYLHYELELNDIVIKKGALIDIENNILDTRTMSKDSVNNYALRIWLSEEDKNSDWMNKYYSYNITVEPIKE